MEPSHPPHLCPKCHHPLRGHRVQPPRTLLCYDCTCTATVRWPYAPFVMLLWLSELTLRWAGEKRRHG